MWLLPYQNFYIVSQLKPDMAMQRLNENINPPPLGNYFKRTFFRNTYGRIFNGSQSSNVFKIIPTTHGRNSFLPLTRCVVTDYGKGSKINIRLKLHPIIIIFCFWILVVSLKINPIVHIDPAAYFISVGFYAFSLIMFKIEVKKYRKILESIFEAQIED
jgi:hypothetical protein